MIKSFKNKQIEEFFTEDAKVDFGKVNLDRLRLILAQLDAAEELREIDLPSFKLKKERQDGIYSISVGGGKKLVFKLVK